MGYDELIKDPEQAELTPVDSPAEDAEEADAPIDFSETDITRDLAVFPDDGPSSGEWVDIDDVMSAPTEEEMEVGRLMGEAIDVEDEDDVDGGVE
jgi:hypothetical protein